MSKLPSNLVKRPAFDNPMRPTEEPSLAVVASTPAVAAGPPTLPNGETDTEEDALIHRVSVRFTDEQWKALHTACYERKLRGERINAAEMLRQIVDEWMARDPQQVS
jgi:hypothetical protein